MLKELVVYTAKQIVSHKDPIAAAADMLMRQRRENFKVIMGAMPGVLIIKDDKEFAQFARQTVLTAIIEQWRCPDFYLPTSKIPEVQYWEGFTAMAEGLRRHNSKPILIPGRDIHIIEKNDYHLCQLVIAIGGI